MSGGDLSEFDMMLNTLVFLLLLFIGMWCLLGLPMALVMVGLYGPLAQMMCKWKGT
jgi:hypothetical protein